MPLRCLAGGRLSGKVPTDLVVHSDFRVGIPLVQSSHFAYVVAPGQLYHLELHRHLLPERREVQLAAKESVWVTEAVPSSSYSNQTLKKGSGLPQTLLNCFVYITILKKT